MPFSNSHYLSQDIEDELKIRFVDCDEYRNALNELEIKLQRICANLVGGDVPKLELPPKGFLEQSLTRDQRVAINALLSERYARGNAMQQRILVKKVHVDEEGQEMTSLKDRLSSNICTFSHKFFHEACGEWAHRERIWYVRHDIAERFAQVCKALNKVGIEPYIEDSFRPAEVQQGLLFRRIVDVARNHLTAEHALVKTIAYSLTAPSPGLAGHQAGAAIDLRLKDQNKQFYDLGNGYAEGTVLSCIDCPYITSKEYIGRMLFSSVMRMGGFRLLPTENWHISHGDRGLGIDQCTASHMPPVCNVSDKNQQKRIYSDSQINWNINMPFARFGPIRDFDYKTGAIDAYLPEDIDRPYFSDDHIAYIIQLSRQKTEGHDPKFKYPLATVIKLFQEYKKENPNPEDYTILL